MALTTSRNGVLFIACREALVLTAYPDGPHPSIGFGHNSAALKIGDKIEVADAFRLLRDDLAKWEDGVNRALKAPVSQHKFDALVSLHHQSGNRYMPAVAALCNAKEFDVAAALFPLCDRNLAGEQKDGLRKRRILESAVFSAGDYGALDPIPYWPGDPSTTARQQYHLQPGDI
ncbi:lysozyme [Methylobacterium sp. E-065]|uniref:lysozyme n=1 Tax=Methylobacterium sp. E-065 TaxID=2836583 RepID=UPI001FB88283|nr:lysozyme [Methylobacterium sp. E-065]MCJ2019590.1 lysozyme [Methylobacterium sp. E-065]